MKQINQASRYVYFPEIQYTHLVTKLCINSIQTHRTETTLNKVKTYINKESYYKREATRPKDKQLTN